MLIGNVAQRCCPKTWEAFPDRILTGTAGTKDLLLKGSIFYSFCGPWAFVKITPGRKYDRVPLEGVHPHTMTPRVARAQGVAHGTAQDMTQGMAQGLAQGMAQGMAQDRAQGMAQGVADP